MEAKTTGTEFHQYLVKLAMEAYDTARPVPEANSVVDYRGENVPSLRAVFLAHVIERMAQAATVYACDAAMAGSPSMPTKAEEDAAEAHEIGLREDEKEAERQAHERRMIDAGVHEMEVRASESDRRPVCDGCGSDIDPDCCGCGMGPDDHGVQGGGHTFIPMGCDCHRDSGQVLPSGRPF